MKTTLLRNTCWTVLAAMLSACSAQSTASLPDTVQPQAQSRAFSPSEVPADIFSARAIRLYNSDYHQIGSISDIPGFVAVDKQGDIYYEGATEGAWHLFIYAPPYNGTPRTISFPNSSGIGGIAVDWKTGVFAVASFAPNPDEASAISFFRHGTTTPCAVVETPNGQTFLWQMSFDASGNLFDYYDFQTIVSISGECHAKTFVEYSPTNFQNIQALQFNAKNQLVVNIMRGSESIIETFPHPAKGQLGNPISTSTLDPVPTNGAQALMLSLTSDDKHLWASTWYINESLNSVVALYNYPEGGKPIKVINLPYVWGAAVYPQVVP